MKTNAKTEREKITVVGETFGGSWPVCDQHNELRLVRAVASDGKGTIPAYVLCWPASERDGGPGVYTWTYSYATLADAREDLYRDRSTPAALKASFSVPPGVAPGPDEDPRLTRILQAAEAHGEESEPAHEAGDLQTVLRECWQRMTPAARRRVYDAWMVQAIVTTWGPGESIEETE